MGAPHYIVILEEGSVFASMDSTFQYERPLQANQIKELADIPDHVADLDEFSSSETVLYLDGGSKEYVKPDAVKTIINLRTLVEEELTNLDKSLEGPEEAAY